MQAWSRWCAASTRAIASSVVRLARSAGFVMCLEAAHVVLALGSVDAPVVALSGENLGLAYLAPVI